VAKRVSRNQVTFHGEDIVDGSMERPKALGGLRRFEALHFPLPSPQRLVRVFGSVVCAQALVVAAAEADLAKRIAVGAQLVGHNDAGTKAYRFNSFRSSLSAAVMIAILARYSGAAGTPLLYQGNDFSRTDFLAK
jgi:uncharacterized protein with PIN domain